MQAFYIALSLFVLGTSALKCCEPKSKCYKEMGKRSLKCDSGSQQKQAECAHHDYFHPKKPDSLSDEEVKEACCQVTCYSLFNNKSFACPTGYRIPVEGDRHNINGDHYYVAGQSADDLQRECCKKPRVSCYTLHKANKFSCPSTHITPTENYMNDDIHENIDSEKTSELQTRCCKQRSLCYANLTAKNLDCDGFGKIPGLNTLRSSMSRRE